MEGMVENFAAMMAGSLGLTEPWYVERANFDAEEMAVRIHVGVRKTAAIACPECGSETKRYGYEKNERVWRHGDCLFYPCYVHCRRPKVLCSTCGTKQINAPFERKNSRFTLLFEGFAMMVLADAPIAKAAQWLRCDEKSLTKILRHWVGKAVDAMDLSDVASLAIDETSFKRGHKYVTLVIDAAKRRVIDVEKGRDGETVKLFAQKLSAKGGDPEKVETVTSDMSKSFLPAIEKNFPNAENVIDKFHVKKVLIDALDEVRKAEQKSVLDKTSLFRGRRLFMIPEVRLTPEQTINLAEMSKRYPLTGRAYRIVAGLDDFYASRTPEEGEIAFQSLYSWMRRCRLKPIEAMKLALEELRKFKHNYLNLIYGFGNKIEVGHIEDLREYYNETVEISKHINNDNIFALHKIKIYPLYHLFLEHISKATKLDIRFILCVESDFSKLPIKNSDMCQVIGIFLDNSREAAETATRKEIKVDILNNNEFFEIYIYNTFTTKDDSQIMLEKQQGRGMGLSYCDKILSKNKHIIHNEYTESSYFVQQLVMEKKA